MNITRVVKIGALVNIATCTQSHNISQIKTLYCQEVAAFGEKEYVVFCASVVIKITKTFPDVQYVGFQGK